MLYISVRARGNSERKKRTLEVDIEHARAAILHLLVPRQPPPFRILPVVLLLLLDTVRYERRPNHIVPRFRRSDVYPVEHGVDFRAFEF